MAKRLFTTENVTFTATANGSPIGTPTTPSWMAVKGGSGTQIIDILEILISGMNTSSVVAAMTFTRVTALESAAGGSALAAPNADGLMNPSGTALSSTVVVFVAATTTGPTPSNVTTDAKLNLSLNTFGGILRWNAAPTQQWWVVGNTTTTGESILYNNSSGGGSTCLANAHIMYEPY
jgi:hypothetical protein